VEIVNSVHTETRNHGANSNGFWNGNGFWNSSGNGYGYGNGNRLNAGVLAGKSGDHGWRGATGA